METFAVEALGQAPYLVVVLVFVIYWSARMGRDQDARDKLMRDFWTQQRQDDRKVMQELVDSVKCLADKLDEHDDKVDERIAAARRSGKDKAGW